MHADLTRVPLQITHLAQMKSVYPEIFSLRYANIPKTTVEGQPSGNQLIIDMSLSDTAAEPVSAVRPAAHTVADTAAEPTSAVRPALLTQSVSQTLSHSTTLNGAGPMSAVRPTAPAQSVSQTMSHNTRLGGSNANTAVPSSTQAVFKAGSTAVMATNSIASESVSKRAVSKQGGCAEREAVAAQSPDGAVAAQSPSEPVRMMAVKAEFERRLEKQVGSVHAISGCPSLIPLCLLPRVDEFMHGHAQRMHPFTSTSATGLTSQQSLLGLLHTLPVVIVVLYPSPTLRNLPKMI